jgi:hypothetical protein
MKPTSNKKRIHGSPQKMQTSIVSCLTNQKKQNTNITPPRTAVVLANNPYRLLAGNTDPDENEETILTSLEPYPSPQTLQTSIVSYSNHKKLNSNPTLPRTALDRAFQAITDSTWKSPSKAQLRSNNPYNLPAETEEDDPDEFDDSTEDLTNESEVSARVEKSTAADTDSTITNSPSKLLLSRKAQQTLKKIKSIRRVLMDNSIREELEAVLGKDAIEIIEDDPEQAKLNNNSDAHTLSNMKPAPSQEDGMIIDKEADTTHTEEAANGPQDTMYAKKRNPTHHQPASIPKEQEHDTRRIPPTSTQGPHTFSISPLTGQAHSCTRNVSFAATVRDNSNLRGGREGHLQGNSKAIPPNPYEKN